MNDIFKKFDKLLNEKIESDSPSVYNEYIREVKKDVLLKSANEFGTPQYILDREMLRRRCRFFIETFRKHIPRVEAFYAFKCNDMPYLVKTVLEEGFNADVAGIYELQLALKLGFKKIVFTGPGKGKGELKTAIENDVIINVDNMDELEEIINLKPSKKVRLGIRINPSSSLTKTWSKFGISFSELDKAIQMIRKGDNLELCGLHFHCSWNQDPSRYVEGINLIGKYLNENKLDLDFLDLGGGFYPEDIGELLKFSLKNDLLKIMGEFGGKFDFDPYQFIVEETEPLENFAKSIAQALKKWDIACPIYLEPGRFIATHSTSILLKVTSIKDDCVITDGGINLVGDYRFEEYSFAPILNLSRPSLDLKRKVIYGALCDPSDLWGYSYYGKDIKKGDILAVLHQGAYTFCCAWRFIKPIAPYIVDDCGKLFVGKKMETFEQRYGGCEF